jgi:hypothetical protein
MNLPVDPNDFADKLTYWEQLARVLAMKAEEDGVILTIHRHPAYPLAMRNHFPWIDVWEKR